MQFECTQCHKSLKLPDEKLPVGKAFSFTCPYCKVKNTAIIPAEENAPPTEHPEAANTFLPQTAAESGAPNEAGPPPSSHHYNEEAVEHHPQPPAPLRVNNGDGATLPSPGNLDEEVDEDDNEATDERPKALIVFDDPEVAEHLVLKMNEIGFRSHIAMNLRDAARQIKFIKFRIMLIQEDYFGSSLSGNHLLRSIQNVDNHVRRGTLVVLISPDLASLDDLSAFALSVDAIINSSDLEQIGQLLQSALAQAQKLYAAYDEMREEQGLD